MEPGPSIVILIPVLYPVIVHFGIDPIQFSVIMAMNLVIGIITPPVAVSLAITGSIAKCPNRELIRELIPFFLAAVFVVLLISYIPQLSLWLPNLVLGPG
jgi:TRAP-type C4-dicarboxylate transport system permease large subunit